MPIRLRDLSGSFVGDSARPVPRRRLEKAPKTGARYNIVELLGLDGVVETLVSRT